jgi:hypothetical protein
MLEDKIAEGILESKLKPGSKVLVELKDGEIQINSK